MMGSSQLKCTPSLTLLFRAEGAKCWHASYRKSISGAGQEKSIKATWHCRVESHPASPTTHLSRNMKHQLYTLLHV